MNIFHININLFTGNYVGISIFTNLYVIYFNVLLTIDTVFSSKKVKYQFYLTIIIIIDHEQIKLVLLATLED